MRVGDGGACGMNGWRSGVEELRGRKERAEEAILRVENGKFGERNS